jgi:Bardet-Biedl syndrome 9 protein
MSLFSVRDRWSACPELPDECDRGALAIAVEDFSQNSSNSQSVRIITGSFKGFIRVYNPRGISYRVEDLELEVNFDQPILQIEWGKFLPGQNRSGLAVLQPRKLSVYSINQTSAGPLDLIKHYEHRFQGNFHAFNMCTGAFGGAFNRDYICVQSCDGCLAVFEHETAAVQRYLPNFIVPGPICYISKLDAFITATGSFTIECFKYQNLGSEGASGSSAAAASLQSDWSVNVGEPIVDCFVSRFSRSLAASQVDIVVITERSIITLRESGAIRLQKRLDYSPATAHCYSTSEEGEPSAGSLSNLLVASHDRSLQVYRDSQLIWAARTNFVPVSIRVASIGGIRGFLIMLSDTCEVCVAYLGTEPPAYSVGIQRENVKELDYERLDAEHRQLLKLIKSAQTDQLVEPKDKLNIRWEIDVLSEPNEFASPPAGIEVIRSSSALVRLVLSYTGSAPLTQVSLALSACRAITFTSTNCSIPLVSNSSSSPTEFVFPIFLRKDILPSSLLGQIIFAYQNPVGEPRTQRLEISFPLALFSIPVPPSKNAEFLLTIDTNRSPPPLNSLFPDLLDSSDRVPAEVSRTFSSVLTLRYLNNLSLEATILVSKKSGRFRVQSTRFEALTLVTETLINRLKQFYSKAEKEKPADSAFTVSFTDPLPLADYFTLIDQHFLERVNQRSLSVELDRTAQQFRLIEKRLLQRFKEKTPAPLNNLDRLSEEIQERLQALGLQIQAADNRILQLIAALECSTSLIVILISLAFSLDESNLDALRGMLPSSIQETYNFGWEEQVESAISFALKTSLAKTGKESAGALNLQPLTEPLKDTVKLKRHIQLMIDRLSKGARFSLNDKNEADETIISPTESNDEENSNEAG